MECSSADGEDLGQARYLKDLQCGRRGGSKRHVAAILAKAFSSLLFIDHGHTEMEWSAHYNSPEHRWTLRHHGVVLTEPSPYDFAEVPSSLLHERMRSQVPGFMAELATWIPIDDIASAQRHAVTTFWRMLFTVRHGTLTSKRRSLWVAEALDPRWRDLVMRAEPERVRGWDPGLPEPELLEQTRQFADYATQWVVSSAEYAS